MNLERYLMLTIVLELKTIGIILQEAVKVLENALDVDVSKPKNMIVFYGLILGSMQL